MFNRSLDTLQQRLSKSPLAVKIAVKLRNQANKIIGRHIGHTHIPSWNGEDQFIESIIKDLKTVFDVGANVGEWTKILLSQQNTIKKVYAFEPGEAAFSASAEIHGNNPIVELHQLALSDRRELLSFYEESNAGEQSSFVLTAYNTKYQARSIQTETIDSFCNIRGIDYIDLLKVDCEGFDLKVLIGAEELIKSHKIKYIQFEYGIGWRSAGSTLKAAFLFLNKYGYDVRLLTPEGLKPYNIDYYGEFFENANFVAFLLP